MNKQLVILRGISGAGKSTFAKTLGGKHVEADMYFIDENGNYIFDVTKIRQAHEICQIFTKIQMLIKEKLIVVSNTFTTEKELKPYYELAEQYGYQVTSLIVENRHGGISEHNVPQETIDKMKNRFSVKL